MGPSRDETTQPSELKGWVWPGAQAILTSGRRPGQGSADNWMDKACLMSRPPQGDA